MASSDFAALLRAQLSEFVATQFAPDAAPDAIREALLTNPALAGLDRASLLAALDDILGMRAATPSSEAFRPRLLVDWGQLPQIGRSARPLFSLIAPPTADLPRVRVTVDRGLDNDPADPLRKVRPEESGIWTFCVPFSLTSNGLDARPGLYLIDIDVAFPHGDDGRPRFLRTQIRLNVPDGNGDRRELVIDGDGQSVVNLAGQDLRSFSRVVLKGGDQGIINIQSFAKEFEKLPERPKESVVFEYALKLNRDIEARLPRRVVVREPSKTDTITLHADGRRIHVIARKRVTFGRSRENDVCLRVLPRSAVHDEASRSISRTHVAMDLVDEGLMLVDESTKGFDVDHDPVKKERLLTHVDVFGSRQIDVPSGFSGPVSLEMDLAVFGRDPGDSHFRSELEWDDICFGIAEERAAPLWQTSGLCGIEAVRLQRLNNLADEEYVALYRHATIGRSPKDHPIALRGLGHPSADVRLLYAGRMFWIHSAGRVPLAVDGRAIEGACLVPLAFGCELAIDSTRVVVGRMAQLLLDDDEAGVPTPAGESPSAVPARGAGGSSLGNAPTAPAAEGSPVPPPPPPPAVSPAPPMATMRAAVSPPLPPPPPPTQPRVGVAADPSAGAASQLSSADPVRAALRSVAVITGADGHGSGFLAAPGLLVTNYHVIADEVIRDLRAVFPDNRAAAGREFALEVLHEDPFNDLAFLRLDADIAPLTPRTDFRHRNGHRIVAIGSPGVGPGGSRLENLVTDGRLGPLFAEQDGPTLWSLSMTVNPGNSGGPVVDADTGEVLAVIVAKFTDTDGHSLAVPFEHLANGLDRASAAGEAADSAGDSLHRQRWCLRKVEDLLRPAGDAVGELLGEMDRLSESSSNTIHALVCDFTGGCGRALATAAAEIKPVVDGELMLLRDDPRCATATRTSLERAWAATERLIRQLSADVGRLEVDIFADDIRAGLSRATNILAGLREELLGKGSAAG